MKNCLLIAVYSFAAASHAFAAETPVPTFEKQIRPLLKKFCFRCHGATKQEAKIDIARFADKRTMLTERKVWRQVLEKLKDKEMPPKAPLPTNAERKLLIEWIDGAIKIDWSKVKHPGHVTMPRLNRDEYINTLRDLLGVDLHRDNTFLEDGEGESGFNNDRDALFMAPALIEKYLASADQALDLVLARHAKPVKVRLEAEKMFMTEQNSPPQPWGYVLNRGQMTLYESVAFPHDGIYRFTVRAWSQGGSTGARLRINDVEKGDIAVLKTEPSVYTLTCFVKAGTHQVAWNIEKSPRPRIESAPRSDQSSNNKPSTADSNRDDSVKDVNIKRSGATITKNAMKNAPRFRAPDNETVEIKPLRERLNNAAYSLQRPYEWLRLLGPQGNPNEIVRFKGYIKARTPAVEKAQQTLAKAMGLKLDEFLKQYAAQNPKVLADNQQLLDAVKNVKPRPAKRKKKPAKPRPKKPGNVAIDWIEIDGPIRAAESQQQVAVFVARPDSEVSNLEAARRIVGHFLPRAFRRPVKTDETERYLKIFQMADARGDSFDESVKLALKTILVSPNFLFRIEQGTAPEGEFRLNDFQLASRLSYFLWMSMPDDELFKLAAANRLHDLKMLDAQIRRMLKDPKSMAFADAFAGQWLGFRALGRSIVPDETKFPAFTPTLRHAMIEETVLFVDSIMREDRSLLELIESNQTFLNEELALLYGVTGVQGPQMQRVTLKDRNRGGVLGMASVLSTTSLPLRTSPVIRGKWVLETLLGEQQPEPPPDAGDLPADAANETGQTLREAYELHRKAARCAACHQRMDPIGFGLENFDAIGRWRDKQAGQPIDNSGVLPDGREFAGPVELRQVLLSRKADFIRNLTGKMLSFALGRKLEYYDEPAIRKIAQTVMENDYRATSLIAEVVKSYPFQFQNSRRNAEETE